MLIDHPVELFVFELTNVTVAVGYLYLALAVMPNIRLRLPQSRIGGLGFFLLGGIAHLNLAFSALVQPQLTLGAMATSWITLVMHVMQAVCIWLFVTGVYIEIGGCGAATGRHGDSAPTDD